MCAREACWQSPWWRLDAGPGVSLSLRAYRSGGVSTVRYCGDAARGDRTETRIINPFPHAADFGLSNLFRFESFLAHARLIAHLDAAFQSDTTVLKDMSHLNRRHLCRIRFSLNILRQSECPFFPVLPNRKSAICRKTFRNNRLT